MRLTAVLALLCLVAIAFAGCAAKGNGSSSSSSSSSHTSTSATNSTTHAPPLNHAPSANVTATPLNGTAPLNVTLELSGNDTDGDALNWTLLYGDGNSTNGTTLPATLKYEYKQGGNFTPTITVRDGKANTTASTKVHVAPGSVGFAPGLDPNCQRPDAMSLPNGYWFDVRGSDPATAYVTGGGDWLYQETNSIPGLQVSQEAGASPPPPGPQDVDPIAVKFNCQNGDTLIQ